MRIGRRNHRVQLQEPVDATDGSRTWPPRETVWANVQETSGDIIAISDHYEAQVNVNVNIRQPSAVEVGWRVIDGSRTLEVKAKLDPTGNRKELELTCVEVVG